MKLTKTVTRGEILRLVRRELVSEDEIPEDAVGQVVNALTLGPDTGQENIPVITYTWEKPFPGDEDA